MSKKKVNTPIVDALIGFNKQSRTATKKFVKATATGVSQDVKEVNVFLKSKETQDTLKTTKSLTGNVLKETKADVKAVSPQVAEISKEAIKPQIEAAADLAKFAEKKGLIPTNMITILAIGAGIGIAGIILIKVAL